MLTASRRHTDSTTAATAHIHPPTQVSLNQMKRAQALMRLGVTEDDLRTAERLFAELPVGDGVSCCFQRTILFHNTVEYPSVSRGDCRLLCGSLFEAIHDGMAYAVTRRMDCCICICCGVSLRSLVVHREATLARHAGSPLSKEERLLGMTKTEISFFKALERLKLGNYSSQEA
eukprot:7447-Heterococcus_DN1.PRE.3